jgi:nucleoside-diphosphate-sugar epimerase
MDDTKLALTFVTGFNGFVGSNFQKFFAEKAILSFNRGQEIVSHGVEVFIHLAGKSHDLKNTLSSNQYYEVNTELTKKVYDNFLASNAKVFITLSSVKAVADEVAGELTEQYQPNPITHYGKSKLLGEKYIFSKEIPDGKRVYVLRPCMIHGPGNKGNLSLLYRIVSKNIPWPLGAFENKRSFCSIDNLMFIFKELIEREDIPSGIYNVADDEPLSINELINLIAQSQNRKSYVWKIPKGIIVRLSKLGDVLHLPLNSERLQKLTDSYVVSNQKIKDAIDKPLPVSSKEGLLKTFQSFK